MLGSPPPSRSRRRTGRRPRRPSWGPRPRPRRGRRCSNRSSGSRTPGHAAGPAAATPGDRRGRAARSRGHGAHGAACCRSLPAPGHGSPVGPLRLPTRSVPRRRRLPHSGSRWRGTHRPPRRGVARTSARRAWGPSARFASRSPRLTNTRSRCPSSSCRHDSSPGRISWHGSTSVGSTTVTTLPVAIAHQRMAIANHLAGRDLGAERGVADAAHARHTRRRRAVGRRASAVCGGRAAGWRDRRRRDMVATSALRGARRSDRGAGTEAEDPQRPPTRMPLARTHAHTVEEPSWFVHPNLPAHCPTPLSHTTTATRRFRHGGRIGRHSRAASCASLGGCAMTTPLWPLFDLVIRTPRLELRAMREVDMLGLIELADRGIHDPDTMPFAEPWTDLPLPQRHWDSMRFFFRRWSEWTPENWKLSFATYADGELVGTQDLIASQFLERRVISSGILDRPGVPGPRVRQGAAGRGADAGLRRPRRRGRPRPRRSGTTARPTASRAGSATRPTARASRCGATSPTGCCATG